MMTKSQKYEQSKRKQNEIIFEQCKQCDELFEKKRYSKKEFCCEKCRSIYNNTAELIGCSYCDKLTHRNKSRLNQYKKHYCSLKCRDNHNKIILKGRNNPNYKGKVKICPVCKKEFTDYASQIYCSPKCFYSTKREVRKCAFCDKEFETYKSNKTRFCSKKCSESYITDNKYITKICEYCGKEFTVRRSRSPNKKMCSLKCLHNYRSELFAGEGNPGYINGTSKSNTDRGWTWRQDRLKAIVRDDGACQICGKEDVKIDVHHIIPYRIHEDNSLENLICLCSSCHIKEDIYYRQFNKPSTVVIKLSELINNKKFNPDDIL